MADKGDRDQRMNERGMEDSFKGKTTEMKGRIKDAAGGLTGDAKLQAEGKWDQLKGKAQDTLGKVERKFGKNDIPDDTP